MPGIGLIKRRLETEAQAVALATSHILKEYNMAGRGEGKEGPASAVSTLETKYDADTGDWYVALGWDDKRAVIRMDSILGTVTDVREV
ncbi:MAG: hypothetical protein OXP12_02940 [Thaumarchaeota archaeon]|nr:hypothetical protein [Nitrososphaerota archaeon]MDE0266255.1 hypothetical protein [Nitrososphaerota archaeon]MDE0526326.1 hypothetical protein [Nitrososphaerota archaeon]